MARLVPATADDRSDAAAFAGRVARWDPARPVRLMADGDRVLLWADTPFDVLATRAVAGTLRPSDVTVRAADLLAGLAVSTAAEVDPGRGVDGAWRARLPPGSGWTDVQRVPAERIAELVREGADLARAAGDGSGAASADLLDSPALQVAGGTMQVTVTMRVLFALSGMGFAPDAPREQVRVRATRTWLRLDARFGAVVRRRQPLLPLLV
ncbi:MAG TPA: hypothetical protein VFM01_00530 [Nakamurella sp.]|nr:hypothetical protein [Nakamurella sp.]